MSGSDTPSSLERLGWSDFFAVQVAPGEAHLAPRRVASVHRARLEAIDASGPVGLELAADANTADYAVGDWVLADPLNDTVVRRLDRKTLLQRHTEARNGQQLAAANVDTLFIASSCNAEFNPARLERYLIMAHQAGTTPVIVLTKADTAADADDYHRRAIALQSGLAVVVLNARSADAIQALKPWCGMGQTVALVGSSGVGKSTLVNTLAGSESETAQKTGAIREHDAQGRHTTTARSLHAIAGGGWVIDTPGIRTLYVSDVTNGIDTLFGDISDLAEQCRFRDCSHVHEPGCALQAAVASGQLDADRLARWRNLLEESRSRTAVKTGPRGNKVVRRNKF